MEKLADDAPLPVDNDANTQELQAKQTGGFSGQGKEALKDIAYGSLAGALGKIVEYPFDTVKVRLQSQANHLPLQYTGPLDCFRQSWRNDGVAGLYRGIEAPMIGAAVETSSLFFSYRLAQKLLQATAGIPSERPLPMSMLLVCGAASGAFTSILLTPIELIKCKLQVPIETPQGIRKVSALTHIADVYRHRGFSGFWHGQMGTLIRETGGSAAWFGSYEGIKILQKKSTSQALDADEPVYQQMIAGAVAGMSYNFLCYPADTIKSRLQTEDVTQVKRANGSFWVAGRLLWQQQGLKGLYRGCGITVARAAPSSALIFSVYEALRKYLG